VRLHDLLAYDRWTLLLTTAELAPSTVQALRAACDEVVAPVEIVVVTTAGPDDSRELGRAGDLTLVRPDGFVGLVAPADRADLVRDYLTTFLSPARSPHADLSPAAEPGHTGRR
jgi:hypothetical protein